MILLITCNFLSCPILMEDVDKTPPYHENKANLKNKCTQYMFSVAKLHVAVHVNDMHSTAKFAYNEHFGNEDKWFVRLVRRAVEDDIDTILTRWKLKFFIPIAGDVKIDSAPPVCACYMLSITNCNPSWSVAQYRPVLAGGFRLSHKSATNLHVDKWVCHLTLPVSSRDCDPSLEQWKTDGR